MPYLTKSWFKTALDCPSQLYYSTNKQYFNTAAEDTFLKELAKGGFQVGTLARCYYPSGVLVETRNPGEAAEQTAELLKRDNVTIFEAAFLHGNCFIRVDILEKKENVIRVIEVKAKSIAPSTDSFFGKKGGLDSDWKAYIYDIAFQNWVVKNYFQERGQPVTVEPYLMLANKDSKCTVEGLNQLFYFNTSTNSVEFDSSKTSPDNLGEKILIEMRMDKEIQAVYEMSIEGKSFEEFIGHCCDHLSKNEIIWTELGAKCKKCDFIVSEGPTSEKASGFHDCWKKQAGFTDEDFKKPMSWSIWFAKSEDWVNQKKYFISDITSDDLSQVKNKKTGLSRPDRQLQQISKTIKNDFSPYVDLYTLRGDVSEWDFPLHCIDFETSAVALPFHKGMRPYEQIAFQFSHHLIQKDGTVTHQTEWINTMPGHFPNFDFIRALKKAVGEEGTIFRYSHHENTVLRAIHKQLMSSEEGDRDDLMSFIKSITTEKKDKNQEGWDGQRTMKDLHDTVQRCWYSLYAAGSISIKDILPAVLKSSKYLQDMYSQPVYGTNGMVSKNFRDQIWVKKVNGEIQNPYKLLQPIFSVEEDAMWNRILAPEESELADGGAAMAAYAKMQFTKMSDAEREQIKDALLRYCELDTLAMVMIIQEFLRLGR